MAAAGAAQADECCCFYPWQQLPKPMTMAATVLYTLICCSSCSALFCIRHPPGRHMPAIFCHSSALHALPLLDCLPFLFPFSTQPPALPSALPSALPPALQSDLHQEKHLCMWVGLGKSCALQVTKDPRPTQSIPKIIDLLVLVQSMYLNNLYRHEVKSVE